MAANTKRTPFRRVRNCNATPNKIISATFWQKITQIWIIPHNMTLFKLIYVLYQCHRQTLPIRKIRDQIQFGEYVLIGTKLDIDGYTVIYNANRQTTNTAWPAVHKEICGFANSCEFSIFPGFNEYSESQSAHKNHEGLENVDRLLQCLGVKPNTINNSRPWQVLHIYMDYTTSSGVWPSMKY